MVRQGQVGDARAHQRQAICRIPLEHHLAHLVVHGVLHACGHDHEHDDEAALMESRETRVLARFGIPDPYRG